MTAPNVITTFPIGNPAGQKPTVVVRDVTNGWDLYTRLPDEVSEYPGSCVKLMTMLLLWEYHQSDFTTGTVTVTNADVSPPNGWSLTSAGLRNGDVITWENLAYAMMVVSGFDACQAVARTIGDEIHAAAGSGTSGNARFVEAMNARAAALGLTNTVFFDSFGGSRTDGTVRNKMSARDLNVLTWVTLQIGTISDIAGMTSHGINITGANMRTIVLNNVIPFFNGPFTNPMGFRDDGVVSAKAGTWLWGDVHMYNNSMVWQAPSGDFLVITTIGSLSLFALMCDQRGLIYSLARDFPYLFEGDWVGSDPNWDNVLLLVAGGFTDESADARTVYASNVVAGDPIVAGSAGGIVIDGASDNVNVAHASDLNVGMRNMTVETWYAGPGTQPSGEYIFGCKLSGNNLEWAYNYYNGGLCIFASTNGTGWTWNVAWAISDGDRAVFFNGAPRHVALVKNDNIIAMYVNGDRMPGTINVGTIFSGTATLEISRPGANALGRLDDFRFTKGVCRYINGMVTLEARKFPRS